MTDPPVPLPGDIPGLLRRGSPVLGSIYGAVRAGVVTLLHPAGGGIITWEPTVVLPSINWRGIDLDLTDATGRAHAAWWLARTLRHATPSVLDPAEGTRWHRSWRGFWVLHCQRGDEHRKWQEVDFLPWDGDNAQSDANGGPHAAWYRFAPSLAGLDGPRKLDDGSPWVDAEALRRVCLHVAGVKP